MYDTVEHGSGEDVETLATIWGRRHGATELERAAAKGSGGGAGARHPGRAARAGARRYRELPVMLRLDDGTLIDGRIDFRQSWTLIDYKTDRQEKRNIAQVQTYALALPRTGAACPRHCFRGMTAS